MSKKKRGNPIPEERRGTIITEIDDLAEYLTERIAENQTVGKRLMSKQATHAFVLYRSLLWSIRDKVQKL